jgi:hypothetical protein
MEPVNDGIGLDDIGGGLMRSIESRAPHQTNKVETEAIWVGLLYTLIRFLNFLYAVIFYSGYKADGTNLLRVASRLIEFYACVSHESKYLHLFFGSHSDTS